MSPVVLGELRLLGSSTRFDSRSILDVVLCGDRRLAEKLRRDDLLPLGSRIRTRLDRSSRTRPTSSTPVPRVTCYANAGNPALMTTELVRTLCEHAPATTVPS